MRSAPIRALWPLSLCMCASDPTTTAAPKPEPAPAAPPTLTVRATGDLLPHAQVKRRALELGEGATGWVTLLHDVGEKLAEADIAMVNLESPLWDGTPPVAKAMHFYAPPGLAQGLKAVGVDVVNVANNHAWDQGPRSVDATLKLLEAEGLATVGAGSNADRARTPAIVERNGLRMAVLGATRLLNESHNKGAASPNVWFLREASELEAPIRAARAAGANWIVLNLHHDVEYQHQPSAASVAFAAGLLDAGVDLIVGHHPHVVQPISHRRTPDGRDAYIAWSLGNLFSAQGFGTASSNAPEARPNTREGAILDVQLQIDQGVPKVTHIGGIPTFTMHQPEHCDTANPRRPEVWTLATLTAQARDAARFGGTTCLSTYEAHQRHVLEVLAAPVTSSLGRNPVPFQPIVVSSR